MATIIRKSVFLLLAVISTSVIVLLLPEFGNSHANASPKASQIVTEELLTPPPALITSTNFLPIIMKPPAAPSVSVVSSSAYDDGFGTLHVVGEVINNTQHNVTFVRVTATLHDSSGNVIRVDYSYTFIDVLAPGCKSPFKINFYSYPPEYTSYRLSVTYLTTTQPAKSGLPILSSSTWNTDWGTYTVGEVQNSTNSNLAFVKVMATYYNSAGIVTNAGYAYTYVDIIGPSQKASFKIYTDNRPYNSYVFLVDYGFTTQSPPSGTSIRNLDIWTEFGSTYFTGEVQNNNGSSIWLTEVIATFYDNVGTVTDVTSTYLPTWILGSGRKGCFKLNATARPYSSYALVNDFSVTTEPLPSLEVLSVTPSGNLHLAGQIRNNHTTQTYGSVKAIGTLYNGTGKVINCEYNYTSPSEIGPGEVSPYDINFYFHYAGWASYSVVASN